MNLRLLFPVALLCLLVSCSKSEKKVASSRPEFNSTSDIPAELQTDLESFGRQLESDLAAKNSEAVRRAFDSGAIADGILEGIHGRQQSLAQFKSGLQEGLGKSVTMMFQQWSGGNAKYKGLALYKGRPAARFRFTGKGGISLVDLVLRKNSQGKVRIVNLCNHAMGYDMVEQSRQTAAPMLAELDKGFLQRLVNKPDVSPADVKQFGELSKSFGSQDYAGVVSAYKGLAPSLKETMPATVMHILALQNLHDDNAYKQGLKEAGKRFKKSAGFQFMLVDAYYLDKEYDQAIECIDNFMQAVERDAALLTLKSLMFKAKGDIPGAQTVLSEALKLEPDCIYAHSNGIDVLLAAKDFAGVRDSMILLEQKGGYAFKNALDDPVWKEFKKAPESARWR